jgi:hypothetical protein
LNARRSGQLCSQGSVPTRSVHNPFQRRRRRPSPHSPPPLSACWKEYKERWGSAPISGWKGQLTTAPALLAAAGQDADLAAHLLWGLEVMADACPQLMASLGRAGLQVGAGRLLALRAGAADEDSDDEGAGEPGPWCVEELAAARARAVKDGRVAK